MISTAAGSRFFIGGPNIGGAADLASFQSDTYTEVGEVEDLGSLGDENAEINFTALKDARVRKLKGPADAGTMPVVCGADSSDEGQDAMRGAQRSNLNFNFKVMLNDAQTPGGTGTLQYFYGLVMSRRRNIGTATNVVRHNFNVAVNSDIAEVDAT